MEGAMERSLNSIITESVRAAKVQLEAARCMDRAALTAATERRQDLLFELDFVDTAQINMTDLLKAELGELQILDRRLAKLLGTATKVFARLSPEREAKTYARNGKIRGYAS
jgi:hypothetical protein